MKKSPEAIKVIASYKESQLPFATHHLTRFGVIKKELAEAINTKEELVRKQLEELAREEQLREEIKTLKFERDIYQRNVEIKMQELVNNIEQQKRLAEEMKILFNEERDKLFKEIAEKDSKHKEIQKQSEERIRELEKELRKSRKNSEITKEVSEITKEDPDTCVIT